MVNQKLILESNKFRDEKIQNEIANNMTHLANNTVLSLSDLNVNTPEDVKQERSRRLSVHLQEELNTNLKMLNNTMMYKLVKQIEILNKENAEIRNRINYTIDNGATPENDFSYSHF